MTELGKNNWDDPNYVLKNTRPVAKGLDLGTAGVPFRNLYVEHIVGGAELINNAEWLQWESSGGVDTDVLRLNASNNVELNAITGQEIDLEINKLRRWYLSSTGAWRQDATNGSDIIFGITAGAIYQSANTGQVFIGGGSAASSGSGGTLRAYGLTNATFPGRAALTGGNVATGDAVVQITNASALVKFLNASDALMWSITNAGAFTQDATNGSDIVFTKATTGIQLQSGANGRTGTFTLNGATPVVISNTSLAAGDQIILSRDTIGGTPLYFGLTSRTNSTGFQVTGTATDTSPCRYTLVRIN